MSQSIEVAVIGGGQAGLSMSYILTGQGRSHIVFEKDRIGEAWRTGRWDSFTLVTPNWSVQLPSFEYQGDEPDGFMPRQEIVQYLEGYAAHSKAPLHTGETVTSVEANADGNGYKVTTSDGRYDASNVVVATGLFQQPKLPAFSSQLPASVVQMHTSQYRNPEQLPPGAVLIVGSGQSGCQIAEELQDSGRQVYLSVGSAGRMPRRYRGKDFVH